MRIITFSTFIFLVTYLFSPIKVTFANDWGLEEQPMERDNCDSIILHYDGKTWNHIYHESNVWLNDIYGFSDNNIFAVGDKGIILHYDGKSWTRQESHTTNNLTSVWGSSPRSIHILGDYGTILYSNGMEWNGK